MPILLPQDLIDIVRKISDTALTGFQRSDTSGLHQIREERGRRTVANKNFDARDAREVA